MDDRRTFGAQRRTAGRGDVLLTDSGGRGVIGLRRGRNERMEDWGNDRAADADNAAEPR